MEIKKIKGHSSYIKGGTNTGIFTFKDKSILVIDPGLSTSRGRRLAELFKKNELRARYCITSHEHLDHFEAYRPIKDAFSGCSFYCAKESRTFLENPKMFYTYVYGAKPNKRLLGQAKASSFELDIEDSLIEGELKLNDIKFHIVDLKGHSHGLAGIITEDKVFYVGDALFDYHIMEKYDFPFIFDLEEYLNSLDKIKNSDFEFALLSHSKDVYDKEQTLDLVEKNRENVFKYRDQIKEFLNEPYTREDLLSDIIELNGLKLDYKEYHYYYSTLGSFITHLMDNNEVEFQIENGKMYYYKTL